MKMRCVFGIILTTLAAAYMGIAQKLQPVTPPTFGNFYSIQHPDWPPLPSLPPGPFVVYSLGSNNFLFDDSALSAATTMSSAGPPLPPGLDDSSTNYSQPDFNSPAAFNTNLLWLEPVAVASNHIYITAHNVIQDYFELWSKTNLLDSKWKIEQQFYRSASATLLPLPPIAQTNSISTNAQMVFWAAQADTLVNVTNLQDAYEQISGYTAGQPGFLFLTRTNAANSFPSDLTVYFTLGGTAVNGVDYIAIDDTLTFDLVTNSITIAALQTFAEIEIDIITNLTADRTVTLTLMTTNGYLPNSNSPSATMKLVHSIVELVAGFNNAAGIDYHEPTKSIITAGTFNNPTNGQPFNFLRIYTNGISTTNSFEAQWSSIQGLATELKLATVKATTGGFTNGDMYFGNGTGVIGWLSADGTASNLNWVTLSNETYIHGGLYVDQTGVFSNNLIVVTGDEATASGGGVWRIDAFRHATRLANITNTQLEGVITLTNDAARWGPWAGKIITGSQGIPEVYAINTNGVVTTNNFGFPVEHFNLIPADQDLYCCSANNAILKVSRSVFANHVGDLLITQEAPGVLSIVNWNAASNSIVVVTNIPALGVGFESVTFAPINLPSIVQ